MPNAKEIELFSTLFNPQLSNAGTGAALTATLAASGSVRSAAVNAGGSGYSVDDVLSVAGTTPATFTVASVDEDGAVLTITRTTVGAGFVDATAAATTVAPAGGTGCTLDILAERAVASVTVVNGGQAYVLPHITVVGAAGDTTAVLTPTVTDGAIASVAVSSGGKYRTAPTLLVDSRGANTNGTFLDLLRSVDENDRIQNLRLLDIIEDIEATTGFPSWASGYVSAAKASLAP